MLWRERGGECESSKRKGGFCFFGKRFYFERNIFRMKECELLNRKADGMPAIVKNFNEVQNKICPLRCRRTSLLASSCARLENGQSTRAIPSFKRKH